MPNVLQDEDYAVINSNYAISAGLNPMTDALAMEDGTSAYVNVLVCKEGNEEEPKIKALAAALQSQKVKDFMDEKLQGAPWWCPLWRTPPTAMTPPSTTMH